MCSWAFKVSGPSAPGPTTVFKHLSVAAYKVPMFVTLTPRRTGAVPHREQVSRLGSLPREARELFSFRAVLCQRQLAVGWSRVGCGGEGGGVSRHVAPLSQFFLASGLWVLKCEQLGL